MASSGRGSGVLRMDLAWSHCTFIDGKAKNLKCKYCEKVLTGEIYWFKHHLARISKDVGECITVLEDVKKSMLGVVSLLQHLVKKSILREL